MYINSEKTLEDYLCNDEKFSDAIMSAFGLTKVHFIGRQLHIGTDNIIDMLYAGTFDGPDHYIERYIIIVELKYRALEAKDYSQLGRYRFATRQYFAKKGGSEEYKDAHVVGVLVGTGITRECGDFLNGDFINIDDVKTMIINTSVDYKDLSGSWFVSSGCSGTIATEFQKLKECLLINMIDGEDADEHRD